MKTSACVPEDNLLKAKQLYTEYAVEQCALEAELGVIMRRENDLQQKLRELRNNLNSAQCNYQALLEKNLAQNSASLTS